jgi:uncharacterized surface protein with fasciclin (FAS1) repeats
MINTSAAHLKTALTRFVAIAAVASLMACASTPPAPPKNVADAIASQPNLSELDKLIKSAGLTAALSSATAVTVFAPSNEAIKSMPKKMQEELANPARLKEVLEFHVLPVSVRAADVKPGNAKTLGGANLPLSRAGDYVTVDDGLVEKADLVTGNGVVHIIDRVLTPPPVRR